MRIWESTLQVMLSLLFVLCVVLHSGSSEIAYVKANMTDPRIVSMDVNLMFPNEGQGLTMHSLMRLTNLMKQAGLKLVNFPATLNSITQVSNTYQHWMVVKTNALMMSASLNWRMGALPITFQGRLRLRGTVSCHLDNSMISQIPKIYLCLEFAQNFSEPAFCLDRNGYVSMYTNNSDFCFQCVRSTSKEMFKFLGKGDKHEVVVNYEIGSLFAPSAHPAGMDANWTSTSTESHNITAPTSSPAQNRSRRSVLWKGTFPWAPYNSGHRLVVRKPTSPYFETLYGCNYVKAKWEPAFMCADQTVSMSKVMYFLDEMKIPGIGSAPDWNCMARGDYRENVNGIHESYYLTHFCMKNGVKHFSSNLLMCPLSKHVFIEDNRVKFNLGSYLEYKDSRNVRRTFPTNCKYKLKLVEPNMIPYDEIAIGGVSGTYERCDRSLLCKCQETTISSRAYTGTVVDHWYCYNGIPKFPLLKGNCLCKNDTGSVKVLSLNNVMDICRWSNLLMCRMLVNYTDNLHVEAMVPKVQQDGTTYNLDSILMTATGCFDKVCIANGNVKAISGNLVVPVCAAMEGTFGEMKYNSSSTWCFASTYIKSGHALYRQFGLFKCHDQLGIRVSLLPGDVDFLQGSCLFVSFLSGTWITPLCPFGSVNMSLSSTHTSSNGGEVCSLISGSALNPDGERINVWPGTYVSNVICSNCTCHSNGNHVPECVKEKFIPCVNDILPCYDDYLQDQLIHSSHKNNRRRREVRLKRSDDDDCDSSPKGCCKCGNCHKIIWTGIAKFFTGCECCTKSQKGVSAATFKETVHHLTQALSDLTNNQKKFSMWLQHDDILFNETFTFERRQIARNNQTRKILGLQWSEIRADEQTIDQNAEVSSQFRKGQTNFDLTISDATSLLSGELDVNVIEHVQDLNVDSAMNAIVTARDLVASNLTIDSPIQAVFKPNTTNGLNISIFAWDHMFPSQPVGEIVHCRRAALCVNNLMPLINDVCVAEESGKMVFYDSKDCNGEHCVVYGKRREKFWKTMWVQCVEIFVDADGIHAADNAQLTIQEKGVNRTVELFRGSTLKPTCGMVVFHQGRPIYTPCLHEGHVGIMHLQPIQVELFYAYFPGITGLAGYKKLEEIRQYEKTSKVHVEEINKRLKQLKYIDKLENEEYSRDSIDYKRFKAQQDRWLNSIDYNLKDAQREIKAANDTANAAQDENDDLDRKGKAILGLMIATLIVMIALLGVSVYIILRLNHMEKMFVQGAHPGLKISSPYWWESSVIVIGCLWFTCWLNVGNLMSVFLSCMSNSLTIWGCIRFISFCTLASVSSLPISLHSMFACGFLLSTLSLKVVVQPWKMGRILLSQTMWVARVEKIDNSSGWCGGTWRFTDFLFLLRLFVTIATFLAVLYLMHKMGYRHFLSLYAQMVSDYIASNHSASACQTLENIRAGMDFTILPVNLMMVFFMHGFNRGKMSTKHDAYVDAELSSKFRSVLRAEMGRITTNVPAANAGFLSGIEDTAMYIGITVLVIAVLAVFVGCYLCYKSYRTDKMQEQTARMDFNTSRLRNLKVREQIASNKSQTKVNASHENTSFMREHVDAIEMDYRSIVVDITAGAITGATSVIETSGQFVKMACTDMIPSHVFPPILTYKAFTGQLTKVETLVYVACMMYSCSPIQVWTAIYVLRFIWARNCQLFKPVSQKRLVISRCMDQSEETFSIEWPEDATAIYVPYIDYLIVNPNLVVDQVWRAVLISWKEQVKLNNKQLACGCYDLRTVITFTTRDGTVCQTAQWRCEKQACQEVVCPHSEWHVLHHLEEVGSLMKYSDDTRLHIKNFFRTNASGKCRKMEYTWSTVARDEKHYRSNCKSHLGCKFYSMLCQFIFGIVSFSSLGYTRAFSINTTTTLSPTEIDQPHTFSTTLSDHEEMLEHMYVGLWVILALVVSFCLLIVCILCKVNRKTNRVSSTFLARFQDTENVPNIEIGIKNFRTSRGSYPDFLVLKCKCTLTDDKTKSCKIGFTYLCSDNPHNIQKLRNCNKRACVGGGKLLINLSCVLVGNDRAKFSPFRGALSPYCTDNEVSEHDGETFFTLDADETKNIKAIAECELLSARHNLGIVNVETFSIKKTSVLKKVAGVFNKIADAD